MGAIGPQALPLYFVVMQLLLAAFAFLQLRKLHEDPTDHHTQFVPMVRTTPTAFEMLPDEEFPEQEPAARH